MRVDFLHKCIEFQMDHYLIFIPVYWRLNCFYKFWRIFDWAKNNNVIERKNYIFSELKNALWHDLFFRCKINPFKVKRDIVRHKKNLDVMNFIYDEQSGTFTVIVSRIRRIFIYSEGTLRKNGRIQKFSEKRKIHLPTRQQRFFFTDHLYSNGIYYKYDIGTIALE